ncbi:hypothetical protein L204_106443 [Cryptococcus depauperatus]|nr:hypothetical protein L204_06171 [Cryptococcus depauperatus CBS 7855]
MNATQYREIAKSVVDEIADYEESIASRDVVSKVEPGYLKGLLPGTAPMEPDSFDQIRADVREKIMPGLTQWSSPKFMAFFPCGRSYPADIAEMYSNAFTGAFFNWVCSPAVTELETIVLDWLAQALGLPQCFFSSTQGGGVIHGSASEAILLSMVAARKKILGEMTAHMPEGSQKDEAQRRLQCRLVALGSSGVHSSTKKAANIIGVQFETVPAAAEHGYSMRGDALANKMEELEARGLQPFFLTATLGTTDVCAVDDFQGIADALAQHPQPEIWVHVDAAYAGSALLLEQHQHLAKPFSAFHSFNFGPHKWMLTTFDCSVTFYKSRLELTESLSVNPPYLKNKFTDQACVTDYRDWQISLGRRFRSLKLWFVMRSYGISGLRKHLLNGITLAEKLEQLLRQREDLFTIFTPAQFALVTVRVKGADEHEVNERTKKLFNNLCQAGEFYLTSTVVDGKFAIRICTGVAAVKEEHVNRLCEVFIMAATKLMLLEDITALSVS